MVELTKDIQRHSVIYQELLMATRGLITAGKALLLILVLGFCLGCNHSTAVEAPREIDGLDYIADTAMTASESVYHKTGKFPRSDAEVKSALQVYLGGNSMMLSEPYRAQYSHFERLKFVLDKSPANGYFPSLRVYDRSGNWGFCAGALVPEK